MKWLKGLFNKKSKVLPVNFDELMYSEDIQKIKAVFEICKITARGGHSNQSAIEHPWCSEELMIWLVSQGADVNIKDKKGDSLLHRKLAIQSINVKYLLDSGLDASLKSSGKKTPIMIAVRAIHAENTKLLLEYGADLNLNNIQSVHEFGYTLDCCRNYEIDSMAKISEIFINAGLIITAKMKSRVTEIAEDFEFHRPDYDKKSVGRISDGLENLYKLFGVEPVKRKIIHDGVSVIDIPEGHWRKQFQKLWGELIPSSGYAQTIQGEVMRIADKVGYEINENGSINWDEDFNKMLVKYVEILESGVALKKWEIVEIKSMTSNLDNLCDNTDLLLESSINWVSQNKMPVPMETPEYIR
ncbi:MAG: ankyrin repeat domain-containing protein [Saccharospirillaceae bacterium]|nr:ankyrin repeat domain-containing protein [Pseudomonadales bacterium]NRB80323.1 ankyrin repeat domain-containing protein [Saccharospirillaceae bacterium]